MEDGIDLHDLKTNRMPAVMRALQRSRQKQVKMNGEIIGLLQVLEERLAVLEYVVSEEIIREVGDDGE